MARTKKVFICSNCGTTSPKWVGKCHSCGEWNTYVEEIITRPSGSGGKWQAGIEKVRGPVPTLLPDIKVGNTSRMETSDAELDRVLGGGVVGGSLVLIGGQPGIGKSTLLLQVAIQAGVKVLYVSGEESEEQIKMRASRIGPDTDRCYIYTETNVEQIIQQAKQLQPQLIVIDSIQTVFSSQLDSVPGSVSQVRESAYLLQRFAKASNIPVVIIGHITKDGNIAGPKLLEHTVDAVLQFEGDRNYIYRLLRSTKNRFGATNEIGIYEMHANGLREVSNPSELLLTQKEEDLSGSAVAATLEGRRPMLIETQALVSTAVYGTPQRSATGFDLRRLSMLLAVLEKRGGFPFAQNDVFLNMAGGLKVDDPAIDLAIVSALISSLEDIAVPSNYCFAAEVGLSGEIRAVNQIEQRIQEAGRLGFEKIFISKFNTKGLDLQQYGIEIVTLGKIETLYRKLFEEF